MYFQLLISVWKWSYSNISLNALNHPRTDAILLLISLIYPRKKKTLTYVGAKTDCFIFYATFDCQIKYDKGLMYEKRYSLFMPLFVQHNFRWRNLTQSYFNILFLKAKFTTCKHQGVAVRKYKEKCFASLNWWRPSKWLKSLFSPVFALTNHRNLKILPNSTD